MADEKIKIAEIASDLNVKAKDIIKVLAERKIEKTTNGTVDADEYSLLIDYYSKQHEIDDINKLLTGDIIIWSPELEKKREAEEKAAAEKARAEAEEKKKAEQAEKAKQAKAAKEKAEAERRAREKASGKSEKDRTELHREMVKERFAAARPGMRTNQKTKESRKEQPRDSKQRTEFAPSRSGEPKTVITAKEKDIRLFDTRIVDIDLSKYDEKSYDFSESLDIAKQKKRSGQFGRPVKKTKPQKKNGSAPVRASLPGEIFLEDSMIVSELARELRLSTPEVIKKLMTMGFMVSVNQTIDFDTAALVADEFGVKASRKVVVSIEDKLFDEQVDDSENLVERSPVVVVMGHVDHGKTSILDAIRNSNVTGGEAGGITQHIGAYTVDVKGKSITFLDTPGHAAFTAMRARGAQATDIAILVVAADDGIMPQTIEAINHAKAAGISIIVAINKMDKPGANPESVKQELTKYDLVPEEWGGDVICVPVSALTKQGIDDLLENVLLVAEMADLKANPNRQAKGVVIEAKLDRGRGPVATVLIQNGTLHTGDIVIAGTAVGRIRAMINDKGKNVTEAGPSTPVEILGMAEVPGAGDIFNAVDDEKMARELAEQRKSKEKEESFKANSKVSLDDLFSQIKEGVKDLNIIVKADVQGSAEAVKSSLEKLSNDEVRVNVIHNAVGGITESDVMLASASNAIIVGFNVRPERVAVEQAERQQIDIRTYRIIYECIEEIQAAMKGLLAPTFKEVVLGQAEVRQTIRVPSAGIIAGSYVIDGKITRNSQIRVLRDNVVIFEDKISSLKRFKDDAKEVAQGYECGIGLEKFNDIKEGDVLEAFVMEEVKA